MQTKVIIAASVLLGSCFVTVMAVVTRLLVRKQARTTRDEDIYVADGRFEQQHQLENISTSWKRLFAPKQIQSKDYWVPTLSGILKAGDDGLFSSALFTNLHEQPGDLPIDKLYNAFASELWTRPMTERSSYSRELSKFVPETKRSAESIGRTKSLLHKVASGGRRDMTIISPRKSLEFSAAERGLARGLSMKRPGSVLVTMRNGLQEAEYNRPAQRTWTHDGQISKFQDGTRTVSIKPAELAALSIMLGSPLEIGSERDNARAEMGAYGISILSPAMDDCKHQVTLRYHKCMPWQIHGQGSGSSLLFTKHLAAGHLPISQEDRTVKSVFIATDTFIAIQKGASLYMKSSSARTPQSQFLESLPSSYELSFHILASSTKSQHKFALASAVALLPFTGGLGPLASTPMLQTIRFIASGGFPAGQLLQRLEGLVHKVNQQSPNLIIFGPLYERQNAGLLIRERARISRIASDPNVTDTLADKTARMSRYITLLQRLMSLVPSIEAQDVFAAVENATRVELECSYTAAVLAHSQDEISGTPAIVASRCCPTSDARSNRQFVAGVPRSDRSSIPFMHTTDSVALPIFTSGLPIQNLGKQLEQVLKMELPLSIDTIAFVARMVIVAWTFSVESVAWEEGEKGFRVPHLDGLGTKMVLC